MSDCNISWNNHITWGVRSLCEICSLWYTRVYTVEEFKYPRKTLRKWALYFTHDAETLFVESKSARNLWQTYGLLQRLLNVALEQCSSTFLSSSNHDILSRLSWNPHQQKCKKTRITCKKIKYFVIRHITKKTVITEV